METGKLNDIESKIFEHQVGNFILFLENEESFLFSKYIEYKVKDLDDCFIKICNSHELLLRWSAFLLTTVFEGYHEVQKLKNKLK